jgi:hypothetical protein
MQSKSLTETLRFVRRLDSLLIEEFEALKKQNLEIFETLQPEKVNILEALAGLDVSAENLDHPKLKQT